MSRSSKATPLIIGAVLLLSCFALLAFVSKPQPPELGVLSLQSPPGVRGSENTSEGPPVGKTPATSEGENTRPLDNVCDLSTVTATRVELDSEDGDTHAHLLVDHETAVDGIPITSAGATLLKLPDWVPNKLGKYYMYFSGHSSKAIAIAYADVITGPWTISHHEVVRTNSSASCDTHVGSPDVHADHTRRKIILFFHCGSGRNLQQQGYKPLSGQPSLVSHSDDGLAFADVRDQPALADFYLRVFRYNGGVFGVCKHGNADTAAFLVGSEDAVDGQQPFIKRLDLPLGSSRHMGVAIVGTTMYIFFTRVGARPESILVSAVDLSGLTAGAEQPSLRLLKPHAGGAWASYREPNRLDFDGSVLPKQHSPAAAHLLLKPDRDYENGGQLPKKSKPGGGSGAQLRDPFILMDDDPMGVLDWHSPAPGGTSLPPQQAFGGWMVYNVQGEYSLAMARVEGLRSLPPRCFEEPVE